MKIFHLGQVPGEPEAALDVLHVYELPVAAVTDGDLAGAWAAALRAFLGFPGNWMVHDPWMSRLTACDELSPRLGAGVATVVIHEDLPDLL